MKDIIAIILNWNDLDRTLRCLKSLKALKTTSCDIIVIDNHSVIDPTDKIKQLDQSIRVIKNSHNLGVAGGRNKGIHYALRHHYKYLLLFDNDAYADPYMLKYLVDTAENFPEAGILGPKIYIDGKNAVIWRAGCTSWKWTYLHAGSEILNRLFNLLDIKIPKNLDTKRAEGVKDEGQYQKVQEIDFQIGCAQLIQTEVFRDVGILDEEFVPYGSEDIDFCARAKRAGWKIYYVPEAVCWHEVRGSFNAGYERTYYNAKNIILLARKNLTHLHLLLFIPDFFIITVPLIIVECIIQKQKMRMKAFINAILWNIKDIHKRGIIVKQLRGLPLKGKSR